MFWRKILNLFPNHDFVHDFSQADVLQRFKFENAKTRIFFSTNLNAGTGEPCAGHKSANFEWDLPIKALILSLTLNLGAALPIGSKNASSKIFQFFEPI